MARQSPVRLVFAVSIAAVLAIFLLYVSVAGGTPSLQPSQLKNRTGVALVGKVVAPYRRTAASRSTRFRLQDVEGLGGGAGRLSDSVPDQFKVGREVRLEGRLQNGVFVGKPGTLVTKCPSKYQAESARRNLVPELGRAALVVCLGLALYALFAAATRRSGAARRLAVSAQNALIAAFGAAIVASAPCSCPRCCATTSRSRMSPTIRASSCRRRTRSLRSGAAGRVAAALALVLTGFSAATVAFNRRSGRDLLAGPSRSSGLSQCSSASCSSPSRARSRHRPLLRTARGSTRASRTCT